MFVSAAPSLRPFDLAQPAHTGAQFPSLAHPRTRFFSRGCGAIETVLRGLDLAPGEGVLAPTYLCGDVVRVFAAASVPVTYYSIDGCGRFDPDEVAEKITPATRAIYVVHYFGFPLHVERIRQVADQAGVMLIEDCAHALFGRFNDRWLGQFGDAAVFSLRKTLPLPDGGALVINNPRLSAGGGGSTPPPVIETLARTGRLMAKRLMLQLGRRPGVLRASGGSAPQEPTAIRGMSAIARRLYARVDVAGSIAKRRENFMLYLDRLGDEALFRSLPEGVVPFSFPVVVDGRDRISAALAGHGLLLNTGFPEAPVIQDAPAVDLSGARSLAARVLELPVHQDLEPHHLEFVIGCFNQVR